MKMKILANVLQIHVLGPIYIFLEWILILKLSVIKSEAGDPVRLVSWWFSRNIQANPIGVNVDAVRDIIKIFGRKPDNVMNGTLKDLVKIHSCFSTIEIWVEQNVFAMKKRDSYFGTKRKNAIEFIHKVLAPTTLG